MDFKKTLSKLLKRTESNVALAGAMVGSVAAVSRLFPPIEHYSTLQVTYYGGSWQTWTATSKEPLSGYWRDFLKWYHGRPQSESYVMRNREGCDMFRRCDVRSYVIRYGERPIAS